MFVEAARGRAEPVSTLPATMRHGSHLKEWASLCPS